VSAAGFAWDEGSAHSAAYDAEITADVFCEIVNRFQPVYQSTSRG
jgi:ribonuclease T